jgi:hypothetical protein
MAYITKAEFEGLKGQVSLLEKTYNVLNATYIESLTEIQKLTSLSVTAAENAKKATFFARDAANNCYTIILSQPTAALLSSVSLVLATAESAAKAAVESAAAAAVASAAAARSVAKQAKEAEQASRQFAMLAAESSRQASEAAAQAVGFSQEARSIFDKTRNKFSKDQPKND